jgi:uncharacterized protein YukJ
MRSARRYEKRNLDMALKNYGVLKGTILGHLRDADDDHYQILVRAGNTMYRIAVNVKSSAPNAPSTLLFLARSTLPDAYANGLRALPAGFKKLPSKPGGLAIDYVRGGWVKREAMKEVPPDEPGVDNDLKDKLEDAVVKAMELPGSLIYGLGQRWGPEKKRRDQYFRFLPGNGIHDIHMNQGNSGKYKKDNGVYQDGAIIIEYPGRKWIAVFLAFQSQSFETDNAGNPRRDGEPERSTKATRRATVTKKRAPGAKTAGTRRKSLL